MIKICFAQLRHTSTVVSSHKYYMIPTLPNEVISGYFVAPIRMTSWPKVNLDQFQ